MLKTDEKIRDAIKKEWDKHGWGWDTHAGQATIRLLPIISAIMSRELSEFKNVVEALTDNINTAGMFSERAKDAVMLYNALKRSGMSEDGLSYAVYAFLIGDKTSGHCPDVIFEKEQSK